MFSTFLGFPPHPTSIYQAEAEDCDFEEVEAISDDSEVLTIKLSKNEI